MKKSFSHLPIASLLFVCLVPVPAFANMGIPMIFITLPGMLAVLIPVIAIEAWYAKKPLNLTWKSSLKVIGAGNSVSTIVGVPLAWGLHLLPLFLVVYLLRYFNVGNTLVEQNPILKTILTLVLGAPWLPPLEWWGGVLAQAMVPMATLILLIPCFFASWFIEYKVVKKLLKLQEGELLRTVLLKANLISYSVLALLVCGWLVYEVL